MSFLPPGTTTVSCWRPRCWARPRNVRAFCSCLALLGSYVISRLIGAMFTFGFRKLDKRTLVKPGSILLLTVFVFVGASSLDCHSATADLCCWHYFGSRLKGSNRGLQLIYLLLDRVNAGLYTLNGRGLLGCEQIIKDSHLYLRRWVLRARRPAYLRLVRAPPLSEGNSLTGCIALSS